MLADYLIFVRNVVLVACIGCGVLVAIQFIKSKKKKKQIVFVNTGVVGSGKTFLAVSDLLRQYRRLSRMYKRGHKWYQFIIPSCFKLFEPPKVYSNIPLMLSGDLKISFKRRFPFVRFTRDYCFSDVLSRQQLLLESFFPSDCTPLVLIDEIGLICNQYSYSDPHIVSPNINDNYMCIETFIRFFRHFYGEGNRDQCRLYLTDQSSSNITVGIRRRLSTIDYLEGFHRYLGFLPFYKVDCRQLLLCDDQMQNVNQTNGQQFFGISALKQQTSDFYFGFLPYKKLSKVHYDSHAFLGCKFSGFVSSVPFTNWSDNNYFYVDEHGVIVQDVLKTNYCPDLRMTASEKAEYKAKLRASGLTLSDVSVPQ